MNANAMTPIASLAQARRNYSRAIAVAVTIVASMLALGALAAIDIWLPMPTALRMVISLMAVAIIAISVFRGWRATRRQHTSLTAAQAIEEARPELGQRIRTALEVADAKKSTDPVSQYFAARLAAESKAAVEGNEWNSLIPFGRAAGWILCAVSLAGILLMAARHSPDFRFALTRFVAPGIAGTYSEPAWIVAPGVFDERHPPRMELRVEGRAAEPQLFIRQSGGEWVKTAMTPLPDGRSWDIVLTGRTSDLELYATAGDGRSPTHTLKFEPIPKLTGIKTTLNFPDYIGRAPETRATGDVSAVEDTNVKWEFTFNTVPKRVEWSIGTDPAHVVKVDPATKTATLEWKAGTSRANAVLSVMDASGEAIDSWRYVAQGFADALPSVELLEPVKDKEATSVTELPVRIRAKDDFGVSEVGLVLEAAGQRDWVLEKVISEKDQKNVTEIAAAMLEKVPLTIRDNVRLYAYALDHKPRGGPRSVSPLRSIDIREFKKRWMFRDSDGGMGGANRQQVAEGLRKIGQIISDQRVIVSDTFLLRESVRSSGAAATASAMPIGKRELELSGKATEIREDWVDKGGIPPDDVTLLDTAITQMQEATLSLGLRGPAKLDQGFNTTDRALTTLLQLRKRLLTILSKGSEGEKPSQEDQMRPLAELANEAERLAREEHDMSEQLSPEAVAGTNIEATRRQHEVVVSDAGELYAAIVDHPQTSEPAIRLMGEAEKAIRAADELLRGQEPRNSRPSLGVAERRLLEVAQFLRAMELTQTNETLKKLASQAEQNARETRGSSQAESKGESKGSDPKSGSETGSSKPEQTRQAARDTRLADEILGALAQKAGGKGKSADAEDQTADKTLGEILAELRELVAAEALAKDLERLAGGGETKSDGKQDGTEGEAGKAADRLNAMAREFRDTAKRLEASRAAKLAAAQAQARELQQQLAAAEKEGEKKGDGKGGEGKNGEGGKKPGEKPGLAQNKPGSQGEGARPREGNKPGAGDKPGDQPGGKNGEAGKKPGGQGLAKGDQPGQGEKPGQGDKPGQGGKSDKPQDNPKGGKGGIAGDIEEARDGGGSQAMGRFSKTLRSVGDEKLNKFAIKLFNAPFTLDSLPDVEAAAQRIQELLAELPNTSAPVASTGRLPESRRREVEDYFRSLSDDFAGEQWDAPKKPGERTE